MTPTEQRQIDEIEQDRRRKEEAILLALLMLCDEAEQSAIVAVTSGADIGEAIRQSLDGAQLGGLLKNAADEAYRAGVVMSGRLVSSATPQQAGDVEPPETYNGGIDADKFVARLVRNILGLLAVTFAHAGPESIGEAFDKSGASHDNPAILADVAATQVNAGYQPGLHDGWMANPIVTGFRFSNPNDDHTSKICRARVGVQLPKNDPWWRVNMPPLHFGLCRSTLLPLVGSFAVTQSPPNLPAPTPGFGFCAAFNR